MSCTNKVISDKSKNQELKPQPHQNHPKHHEELEPVLERSRILRNLKHLNVKGLKLAILSTEELKVRKIRFFPLMN